MTVIEKKPLDEALVVNFDKLRRMGTLSGWQRQVYMFIVRRMGAVFLPKLMEKITDYTSATIPEDTDPEEVKDIIKVSFIDYIDSIM